jgi:hypothetical protein
MSILKLPGGLELWFSDDSDDKPTKAYTVPARSELLDIQQTVVEVKAWLTTNRPSQHQLTRRPLAESVVRYLTVHYWLDVFEDQYP